MLFEVWLSGWTSLLSPPPLQPCPIPATRRTHLKWFAYRADTRRWLARWKHSASGLPYQWRQCCVTHRERTSCSLHFSFFCFKQQPLHCLFFPPPLQFCFVAVRKRCGANQWSTPSDSILPLWMHRGLFPVSTFVVYFSLDFHWLLRSPLVWLQLWTLSPESCVFEVSDELFPSSPCLMVLVSRKNDSESF